MLAPLIYLTTAGLLACLCLVVAQVVESRDSDREAARAWTDYLDRH